VHVRHVVDGPDSAQDNDAEAVLLAVEAGQPRQIVGGECEVGDGVLVGDLVRPAAQPGQLRIGQVGKPREASPVRRSPCGLTKTISFVRLIPPRSAD
jgi:hypothetical protein